MKKKLLLLIAIVLLLVGCKQDKFYLKEDLYKKGEITEINSNTLKKLEKNKENFAVFVFLPGCSSGAAFNEVLTEFVEQEEITIYSLSIMDAEGTGVEDVEYAPSLVLYNKGKVVDMLDSASDEDTKYFKEISSLKEWLEEKIYLDK